MGKGPACVVNLPLPPGTSVWLPGGPEQPPPTGRQRSHTRSYPAACRMPAQQLPATGSRGRLTGSPARDPGWEGWRLRPPHPAWSLPSSPAPCAAPGPPLTLPLGDGDHAAGCLGGLPGRSRQGARSREDQTCACSREADP